MRVEVRDENERERVRDVVRGWGATGTQPLQCAHFYKLIYASSISSPSLPPFPPPSPPSSPPSSSLIPKALHIIANASLQAAQRVAAMREQERQDAVVIIQRGTS